MGLKAKCLQENIRTGNNVRIYLPMSADLFHIGHLRAIRQCAKLGTLYVGLLTERALKGYKECVIPYRQRKELLEAIPEVHRVIPQNSLNMYHNLVAYDITMVASGDGFEPKELKAIEKAGCEVLKIKYYKGQSTTEIKRKLWSMKH